VEVVDLHSLDTETRASLELEFMKPSIRPVNYSYKPAIRTEPARDTTVWLGYFAHVSECLEISTVFLLFLCFGCSRSFLLFLLPHFHVPFSV